LENTETLNIRISLELKQTLEQQAQRRGQTVSDYVRELLTGHVLQGGDGIQTEAIEKSIKLRFKGKPPLDTEYHSGSGLDFHDGEEKEVPEAEAKRLLRDFSSFFECV
jgi:hypothetical protein